MDVDCGVERLRIFDRDGFEELEIDSTKLKDIDLSRIDSLLAAETLCSTSPEGSHCSTSKKSRSTCKVEVSISAYRQDRDMLPRPGHLVCLG